MYIFFRIPLIAFKFALDKHSSLLWISMHKYIVLSIFTKVFYYLNSCFAVVAQLKKKMKELNAVLL